LQREIANIISTIFAAEMNTIRENILVKYIWLFLAIHILNFSIDAPDAKPDYVAEDLSINDIESVVELLLEEACGFENIISEHDEHDSNDGLRFGVSKIILFHQPIFDYSSLQINLINDLKLFPFYEIDVNLFHLELDSPPPKLLG
jgi:hypothetical protein